MPTPYQFPLRVDGWTLRQCSGLAYAKPPEEVLMFANDLGAIEPPRIIIPRRS
jgi:hypothetical protein